MREPAKLIGAVVLVLGLGAVAGRAAVAVVVGVVLGELAAVVLFSGPIDRVLDERAARNLLQYLADQYAAAGAVPDDRTIIIERYLDEVGDWRVCVLTPFGGKVHAPWAMAIGAMVRERSALEIDVEKYFAEVLDG